MAGKTIRATTESEVNHGKKKSVETDTGEDKKTSREIELVEDFDRYVHVHLMGKTVAELQEKCLELGFAPGRATKECMVLALLCRLSQESKQEFVTSFRDLRHRKRGNPVA